MATLAVRPLNLRDLPRLGYTRRRNDIVDPDTMSATSSLVPRHMLSLVPWELPTDRGYAALIDDELCATLLMRPRPESFRWNVVALSAGSPRLVADDDVYVELWTALLEFGIRGAGESGAKRLFAAAPDTGPSYRALRGAGFEPFVRRFILERQGVVADVPPPQGFRRQEPSDVWSVHQLYHHTTPRPVQAAEAYTSSAWELHQTPLWKRVFSVREQAGSFVIETRDGIEAFCRVDTRGHRVVVEWMATPGRRGELAALVNASAREILGSSQSRFIVSVPEYAGDVLPVLEASGFENTGDRLGLVRHTTVPAIVHSKLLPAVVVESGERVPRGVPSYYRFGGQGIAAIQRLNARSFDRTERREH